MTDLVVHAGQPRAWSTTIQNFLHEATDINYLGIFPSFPNRHWYKGDVGEIFEFGIRFENERGFYDRLDSYRERLQSVIIPEKINVVSCETISFKCFPQEVDTKEKLRRLSRLLEGIKITFIYVWRHPEFLIPSYYRELVRIGISQNFQTFLENSYRLRRYNFCDDLCGKTFVSDLSSDFPNSKIHRVVLTDNMRNDHRSISDLLSESIGLRKQRLPHSNKSLSDQMLSILLTENLAKGRISSFDSFLETHRMFPSEAYDDGSWVWHSARQRRDAVRRAENILNKGVPLNESCFDETKVKALLDKLSANCCPPLE